MTRASSAAAEAAFRDERTAVLATLIRQLGDFQLAEDAWITTTLTPPATR